MALELKSPEPVGDRLVARLHLGTQRALRLKVHMVDKH